MARRSQRGSFSGQPASVVSSKRSFAVAGRRGSREIIRIKGSLLFLLVFVYYVFLTIWLLLHLEMPKALAHGLPIHAVPIIVMKTKKRTKQHRELK